jgi:CheY-like chemotaxis protein
MLSGSAIDSDTKVLIVEDDSGDRKLLSQICEDVGFAHKNIFPALELEQAIEMLNQGWVDLVLLDLALDDTDNPRQAISLLERWEKETGKKKIPVIVVSRHTEAVKQAAKASCVAVIRKPGVTEGEKTQFNDFLQFAIRKAISKRSVEATFRDRIRQQFDRIVSRIMPGSPHVEVAPGIHVPVTSLLGRVSWR